MTSRINDFKIYNVNINKKEKTMKKIKLLVKLFYVFLLLNFVFVNATFSQEVIWQFSTNMGSSAWVEELTIINDVSGNGIPEVIAGTKKKVWKVYCIEGETGNLIWDYDMLIFRPVGDLKTIEDLNSNGSQEVLVAEGFVSTAPPIPPEGPKLFCLDGENGNEIWSFTPDPQSYITAIDVIPDVTGDGVSDVIAGSYNYWVSLVDGSNGNQVWTSSVPAERIHAVSSIGDVNNDGLCDVLIGTYDNPGIETGSYCFSGADGTMIWERTIGDIQTNCVKSIPDINDDGIEDVIIGSMEGIMYAFSGTSFPPPIWQTPTGTGEIIQEVVITQDINGDGKNEVIAGSWDDNVYCFDGATGDIEWTYQVVNWVHTVAITEDISGDGIKDVLVGDRGNAIGGGAYAGSVYYLDGFTGTLMWSYQTGDMVWAVSQIEDVNGNGASDVIAGSDDGYVYCFEGNQNVGIEDENMSVSSINNLSQNYPNPFNTETTIHFTTENSDKNTNITIYNFNGQKIKTLVDKKLEAGIHNFVWDGTNDSGNPVSGGIYSYKMKYGDKYTGFKKMILMK